MTSIESHSPTSSASGEEAHSDFEHIAEKNETTSNYSFVSSSKWRKGLIKNPKAIQAKQVGRTSYGCWCHKFSAEQAKVSSLV